MTFSRQLSGYIRQGYRPPEAMRLTWLDVRAGKVSPPPRPGRARGPRKLSRRSVALMRRENPLTRRETAEILRLARIGRKAARGHRRFGDPQALRLAAYLTGRAERGIEIASEYGTVKRRHAARLDNPWSVFAGGTGAAEGKHSYSIRPAAGVAYYIQPVTTQYGRHRGYLLQQSDQTGRSGPGLWRDLGMFRSPNAAKKAARIHAVLKLGLKLNPVTPSKAREILRHGEVGGRPLTPAQRGMFGVRAGGGRLTRLRRGNPYYAVVDRGGGPGELPLLGGVNRYESWPYSRHGDAEQRALDFARANLDAGRKVGRVRIVYKRRDPMRRAPLTAQDVGLVRKHYPREEFGNAPWRGVELYNRVLEIRAQKGNTGRYPRKKFFHRFKQRARMIGLPNGDLLITGR